MSHDDSDWICDTFHLCSIPEKLVAGCKLSHLTLSKYKHVDISDAFFNKQNHFQHGINKLS